MIKNKISKLPSAFQEFQSEAKTYHQPITLFSTENPIFAVNASATRIDRFV
jgi:hypothetical protein